MSVCSVFVMNLIQRTKKGLRLILWDNPDRTWDCKKGNNILKTVDTFLGIMKKKVLSYFYRHYDIFTIKVKIK